MFQLQTGSAISVYTFMTERLEHLLASVVNNRLLCCIALRAQSSKLDTTRVPTFVSMKNELKINLTFTSMHIT